MSMAGRSRIDCATRLEVLRAVRAAWPAEQAAVGANFRARLGARRPRRGRSHRRRDRFQGGRRRSHQRLYRTDRAGSRPVYGRMWQTPFADKIRNEVGIATMAVGNIFEPDHVNTIVGAGRADLCAIARPHLADPAWTLHAAASQRYAVAVVAGSVSLRQEPARAQPRARAHWHWAPSDGGRAARGTSCAGDRCRSRHRRGHRWRGHVVQKLIIEREVLR